MSISREDLRFWDRRTLERRVRKNLVTKKEIEKTVKGLPDVTDKIAPMEEDAPAEESVA